jgi:nucleoside-diphosphate-sugar epimerase
MLRQCARLTGKEMKVVVAGATGAIGRRLIPLLVTEGHQVVATTRSSSKVQFLRNEGAEPVVMDGLNKDAVMNSVMSSRPDVIVHQMTSLASMRSLSHYGATNRRFAVARVTLRRGKSKPAQSRIRKELVANV